MISSTWEESTTVDRWGSNDRERNHEKNVAASIRGRRGNYIFSRPTDLITLTIDMRRIHWEQLTSLLLSRGKNFITRARSEFRGRWDDYGVVGNFMKIHRRPKQRQSAPAARPQLPTRLCYFTFSYFVLILEKTRFSHWDRKYCFKAEWGTGRILSHFVESRGTLDEQTRMNREARISIFLCMRPIKIILTS